jgi:predicted RNA binding protein YcfA (HicA-like mRNA interferase family)
MGIKKSIRKLLSLPVEMRYAEVNSVLVYLGFRLKNIKGSHFGYKNPVNQVILVIVAHNKLVKRIYLKEIITYVKKHGGIY